MPVTGRKPKDNPVNRNPKAYEWTEVPNTPFSGGPQLPAKREVQVQSGGTTRRMKVAWPAATRRWWKAVSTMPHCVLWTDSDWSFALDTAEVAACFHDGDTRQATELRNRERVLGTTVDFRRDLRIRYVDPPAPAADAEVTRLDDYRDL